MARLSEYNENKISMLRTQIKCLLCLMHSPCAVFTLSRNAAWFILQKIPYDITDKNSSLLGCGAMSFGEWFPSVLRTAAPASSLSLEDDGNMID